jgi:hypothetical protein
MPDLETSNGNSAVHYWAQLMNCWQNVHARGSMAPGVEHSRATVNSPVRFTSDCLVKWPAVGLECSRWGRMDRPGVFKMGSNGQSHFCNQMPLLGRMWNLTPNSIFKSGAKLGKNLHRFQLHEHKSTIYSTIYKLSLFLINKLHWSTNFSFSTYNGLLEDRCSWCNPGRCKLTSMTVHIVLPQYATYTA